MALEVSYWTGFDPITRLAYGINISRVSVTLTGSSASLGTIPTNAAIARLKAGEACCVSNNGSAASATNGTYLDAGDSIDVAVLPGTPMLGMTVA